MGQIIMTVEAINWTDGNVGHVKLCLNGGSCHIDWGDGCTCYMQTDKCEWLYDIHFYSVSCKAEGRKFDIVISSDGDNIIGIWADSGEMNVYDIDISKCQSLEYFRASYLINHFDLTTNPGLKIIELKGEACGLADFSRSTELKELYYQYTGGGRYSGVKKLDLTKCDKLECLECRHAYELTHIIISNKSALKELVYDEETPLSGKPLEIIKRTIERNGGKIIKENNDIA